MTLHETLLMFKVDFLNLFWAFSTFHKGQQTSCRSSSCCCSTAECCKGDAQQQCSFSRQSRKVLMAVNSLESRQHSGAAGAERRGRHLNLTHSDSHVDPCDSVTITLNDGDDETRKRWHGCFFPVWLKLLCDASVHFVSLNVIVLFALMLPSENKLKI